MTLALLLTAVTGAWAEETPLVTIQASENSTFTSGSKTFNDIATVTITGNGYIDDSGWESCMLTVTPADGVTITSVKFYGSLNGDVVEDTSSPFEAEIKYDSNVSREVTKVNGTKAFDYGVKKIEVFGTAGPPLAVEWNASTKTGTFTQPGSDVVLTPIYAKTAAFATTGTGSEMTLLLPAAAEGVIAGTDAPLIVEGTGIVATTMIGETPTAQGTVMYYVGTSAPTIGSDDWTEDVPIAKGYDDAATVTVWYYIQGADAPATVAATLDNTFNDSEVSSLTVTVLSNKFDLTLKAANANTIDATQTSKGTVSVKVGDADAEDKTEDITDEGKLTAIKMGSEVKLNAKQGYKFRKVEVKKKSASTPLDNTTTAWTAGTFAVPAGGLTYSDAITVSGDVTLTLTDGETLTLNKGISLASGATLTIQGNGTMNVNGTSGSTASTVDGSGTLVLTSGTLNAKGGNGGGYGSFEAFAAGSKSAGGVAINGAVTVSGGTLTAIGGAGGSIEDHNDADVTAGAGGAAISGSVTLVSGTLTATGGNGGNGGGFSTGTAGAGGAAIGGDLTVNGGTMTTTNGSNGVVTSDPTAVNLGAGGKAVAGTLTDNR